jgi:hypothetical protein
VAQHLKIDYDRFKDDTTVSTEVMNMIGTDPDKLLPPMGLQFAITHKGKSPMKPQYVALLYTFAEMNMWYSNSELNLICDGERLNLGSMKVDVTRGAPIGRVIVRYMLLSKVLPYDTFKKIASSKVVEMRIGNAREFTFSESTLKRMKELIDYAEPAH